MSSLKENIFVEAGDLDGLDIPTVIVEDSTLLEDEQDEKEEEEQQMEIVMDDQTHQGIDFEEVEEECHQDEYNSSERLERPLFVGLREEWINQEFADVQIFCQGHEQIRSHRLVLGSISPMIRMALENDPMKENDSTILIPDVDAGELSDFLQKAYEGGIEEVDITDSLKFIGFTDGTVEPCSPKRPIKMEPEEEVSSNYYAKLKSKKGFEENLNYIPTTPSWENYYALSTHQDLEQMEQMPKEKKVTSRKYKRSSPGTSPVWHFFKVTTKKTRVICKDCGKRFRNVTGITSTLSRHLEVSHDDLYEKLQDMSAKDEKRKKVESGPDTESGLPKSKRRSKRSKRGENESTADEGEEAAQSGEEATEEEDVDEDNGESVDDVEVEKKILDSSSENLTGTKMKEAIWNYFDEISEDVYACKACEKSQTCKPKTFSVLIRHLRVDHERLYRQFLIDGGYGPKQVEEQLNRKLKKRGPRARHHDGDLKSRTCPECGKVYSKVKGMMVHMEAVHSGKRPFVCEECGMSFARKESFKRHNHDDVRPFLCSVCGKTFARRHIRDIHERAHRGDKRYPCGYCTKKFVTNQKKTIHERIHTGEKPFECGECGKKFVQKHQLSTHTRIHTGARPYRCDHCNQMFRHLSTKAKHNCPGKPRESGNVVTQNVRVQQQQDRQQIYPGIEVFENKETIMI